MRHTKKNLTMHFDLILQNINRYISLNNEEEKIITSYFEFQTVKRKIILLKEGAYSAGTWFVNKGVLRTYRYDNNGAEHIGYFAPQDWWMGDMYSNIAQKPSFNTIDAVEDSELLFIKETNKQNLLRDIPKLERFFRIIIEKHLVSNQERLMDSMILTAQERYIKFCEKYPSLINTLPQKQIAAYIGVTPEFLSKMKSQYLRGKKS
jgi:CRP/FNR family transcriptional regulator, anaerobic regulatory protein